MLDIPTKHQTYKFLLDSIKLKYRETGGYVDADIVQLTRWLAFWGVDRCWWKFRGPFVKDLRPPEDRHWKWVSFVRRLRKNPWARCAAARTKDGHVQGAIIYRRDGASILEPNKGAVYVEYVAAAPCNRRDYAENPLYLGVGEGLMSLPILHSYDWGLGGRVVLFSLPGSSDFYKKLNFLETGERENLMIHQELTPDAAVSLLEDRGLI